VRACGDSDCPGAGAEPRDRLDLVAQAQGRRGQYGETHRALPGASDTPLTQCNALARGCNHLAAVQALNALGAGKAYGYGRPTSPHGCARSNAHTHPTFSQPTLRARFAVDLNSEASCKALAAEVAKHHPKLHLLFNNAGVTWGGSFDEYPESAWNKLMTVNVASVFHMTRAYARLKARCPGKHASPILLDVRCRARRLAAPRCLPMLLAAANPEDPPRVINIGSIAGLTTSQFDNAYAYAASKAAVAHLTRLLAAQLTSQGQRFGQRRIGCQTPRRC